MKNARKIRTHLPIYIHNSFYTNISMITVQNYDIESTGHSHCSLTIYTQIKTSVGCVWEGTATHRAATLLKYSENVGL